MGHVGKERQGMTSQVEATAAADLKRCWRRWAAIVGGYARGRGGLARVSPAAYAALHKDLLAACECLAGRAEAPLRDRYRRLADLASPWVTLDVLSGTDREIL